MRLDRRSINAVQNTGFGWWNEGAVAETLRTNAGGGGMIANLVVYEMTHADEAVRTHKGGYAPPCKGEWEQEEIKCR